MKKRMWILGAVMLFAFSGCANRATDEATEDQALTGTEIYEDQKTGESTDDLPVQSEDIQSDEQDDEEVDGAPAPVEVRSSEKEMQYDLDGNILGWWEKEYDGAGNMVKETKYREDGSVSYWWEYEYDADGNQIKKVEYVENNQITCWYEYEYDPAGNMVKKIEREVYNFSSNSKGLGRRYEYEYDENGNEVKYIAYEKDNQVIGWAEKEYDAAGRLVKEDFYQNHSSPSEYGYEYDASGNKIRTTDIRSLEEI